MISSSARARRTPRATRTVAIGLPLAAVLWVTGCQSPSRGGTVTDATGTSTGATATPTGATAARPTLPVGRSSATLAVGGTARTYHLYRPASVTGRTPTGLVVMLHGGFGSGTQAENSYGWDTQADRAGFVVAYPDGLNRAWNVGGGCCGAPGRTGVDDVGFVTAMLTSSPP